MPPRSPPSFENEDVCVAAEVNESSTRKVPDSKHHRAEDGQGGGKNNELDGIGPDLSDSSWMSGSGADSAWAKYEGMPMSSGWSHLYASVENEAMSGIGPESSWLSYDGMPFGVSGWSQLQTSLEYKSFARQCTGDSAWKEYDGMPLSSGWSRFDLSSENEALDPAASSKVSAESTSAPTTPEAQDKDPSSFVRGWLAVLARAFQRWRIAEQPETHSSTNLPVLRFSALAAALQESQTFQSLAAEVHSLPKPDGDKPSSGASGIQSAAFDASSSDGTESPSAMKLLTNGDGAQSSKVYAAESKRYKRRNRGGA